MLHAPEMFHREFSDRRGFLIIS